MSAELSARGLRFDCCLRLLLGLHLLLRCHLKLAGTVLLCFFSRRLNLVDAAAFTRIAGCSCITLTKITVSLHSGTSESES